MARKRTNDHQFPGAVRVHDALLKRIKDGEYVQGMWLPTEKALSAEFDVDRSAVRGALVKLAEANLIVREHGRRPIVRDTRSAAARPVSPNTDSPKTIAAIVFQIEAFSGIQPLMRGVQQGMRELDGQYRLLIFDTQADTFEERYNLERKALEALESEGISGAIFWSECLERTTSYAKELMSRGVPLVYVDRQPDRLPCDFVGIDDRMSARAAVTRLIELGHRRIGCLTHNHPVPTVVERIQGYVDALQDAGIRVDPALTVTFTEAGVPVSEFLDIKDPPTAVFAINDLLAYQMMHALDRRSVRVPEDVSVLGFDDLEHYMPGTRNLSSVHIPFQRIGYFAMKLLLRRLQDPNPIELPYQQMFLPTTIVERSTTAAPDAHIVYPVY